MQASLPAEDATDRPYLVGRLLQPRATADWLLTVAAIVRQRFFTPAAMRENLILLADPVVTVSRQWVRCEGFSSCCGVYARLDLGEAAIEATRRSFGTTNVDFGEAMRTALTQLRDGEEVDLQVGAEGVGLSSPSGTVVERRVELPLRWLRGFGEVQAVMAGLEPVGELAGREVLLWLRSLPRMRASGWLQPNGRSMRLSPTASSGGIRIGGAERLALLEPVARHATSMALFGMRGAAEAPFGVVLQRPGLHLTVVLSSAPWRGFSGEGALLRDLLRPVVPEVLAATQAALSWHQVGERPRDPEAARALARIALAGSAGFSLLDGNYFRRELPLPRAALADLQPRLVAAQELVAANAVRWQDKIAEVVSSGALYRVQRDADGEWTCTCPWFAKGRGEQGPCKHALAAEMTASEAHRG